MDWVNLIYVPFETPASYFTAGGITVAVMATLGIISLRRLYLNGEDITQLFDGDILGPILFLLFLAFAGWPLVAVFLIGSVITFVIWMLWKLIDRIIARPIVERRYEKRHDAFVNKHMKAGN